LSVEIYAAPVESGRSRWCFSRIRKATDRSVGELTGFAEVLIDLCDDSLLFLGIEEGFDVLLGGHVLVVVEL
jgi:hypothetical protein